MSIVKVCEQDGQSFHHTSSYNQHKNVHNSEKYTCDICYKKLSSQKHCQIIKKRHYQSLNSFSCDTCEKQFNFRKNVDRHTKVTHEGRQFACVVCAKQFGRKDKLKRHFSICKTEKNIAISEIAEKSPKVA